MVDFGSKDGKNFCLPVVVADTTGEDGTGTGAEEVLGAAHGKEILLSCLQRLAVDFAFVEGLHTHSGVLAQFHQVGVGAVLVALDVEHLASVPTRTYSWWTLALPLSFASDATVMGMRGRAA